MKKLTTFAVLALIPSLASAVTVTVPEPGTFSLMFMGLAMMGAIKFKK